MNSSNNSQSNRLSLNSAYKDELKEEKPNPDSSTVTSYWIESFLDSLGNTALNIKRRYALRNKEPQE